jgi:valyl-tRNA synthetase
VNQKAVNLDAESDFENVRGLVVAARNAKAEAGLQRQKPSAQVATQDPALLNLFEAHRLTILRLAGLASLDLVPGRLEAGTHVTSVFDFQLVHEEHVDKETERLRLAKEKGKLAEALERVEKQLGNRGFLDRAPENVVRATEERRSELQTQFQKVVGSLERLS